MFATKVAVPPHLQFPCAIGGVEAVEVELVDVDPQGEGLAGDGIGLDVELTDNMSCPDSSLTCWQSEALLPEVVKDLLNNESVNFNFFRRTRKYFLQTIH